MAYLIAITYYTLNGAIKCQLFPKYKGNSGDNLRNTFKK